MIFRDRRDAGRALAAALKRWQPRADALVLALPRGGVPVAYEVAQALDAPLDILIVRKLGVPGHEEYAMGAIATGGVRVLDDELIARLGLDTNAITRVIAREHAELERRRRAYLGTRHVGVAGRTVLLVDDGLATGSTMRAAVMAVRAGKPRAIVVAVPVGSEEACAALRTIADEVVCLHTPEPFHGVGRWYEDFAQTTDDEVRALLALAPAMPAEHDDEGPAHVARY